MGAGSKTSFTLQTSAPTQNGEEFVSANFIAPNVAGPTFATVGTEFRAMATVFFSYAHADEALRDQLEKQLALLKRQGVIETWHDRRIGAGADFAREIDEHVNSDDILLLLVSPDFLDSDYCYDLEMQRALERHDAGEAVVIPVILRPCEWTHAPFGKLNATPPDGKPVTKFADRDDALLEVAKAIRAAAEKINGRGPVNTKRASGLAIDARTGAKCASVEQSRFGQEIHSARPRQISNRNVRVHCKVF